MPPADLPDMPPHIIIVESTYGVSRHLPRNERESRFLERVHTAVSSAAGGGGGLGWAGWLGGMDGEWVAG